MGKLKEIVAERNMRLILDAERRIGSYIATGGDQTDNYVIEQIAKIRKWEAEASICMNQNG